MLKFFFKQLFVEIPDICCTWPLEILNKIKVLVDIQSYIHKKKLIYIWTWNAVSLFNTVHAVKNVLQCVGYFCHYWRLMFVVCVSLSKVFLCLLEVDIYCNLCFIV